MEIKCCCRSKAGPYTFDKNSVHKTFLLYNTAKSFTKNTANKSSHSNNEYEVQDVLVRKKFPLLSKVNVFIFSVDVLSFLGAFYVCVYSSFFCATLRHYPLNHLLVIDPYFFLILQTGCSISGNTRNRIGKL
jgi:hypothetical protein